MPRNPASGDVFDIRHIAHFMPYCDIFIVDNFFREVCNSPQLRIGEPYNTKIRSLGENEIDGFIEELEKLIASAPQTNLSKRISDAILSGGFPQEQTKIMQARLAQRKKPN